MLPTVPNGKKWPSVFLGLSMEDLGNGWVLGQLARVGSEIDTPGRAGLGSLTGSSVCIVQT